MYHVTFGSAGVTADYRISASPNYIVVQLAALNGGGVEAVQLAQLSTTAPVSGVFLKVRWDDQFALTLMGLSQAVETEISGPSTFATVYPEYGMIGEKVAIIATPTTKFLTTVHEVERDFDLPSPKIAGSWAKESQDVRTSYLFVDMTEANADEMIRYAKLAGMKYILIYDETWSSSEGSYPISKVAYPHGEEGLKEVVAKCHAAGLKVGLHMMTSLVGKTDPMVRPVPSQGLLTDARATLATDIKADATELIATAPLSFSNNGGDFGDSSDVWIDNEIIHYAQVNGTHFVRCTRGYSGTIPAAHRAGAAIKHLVQQDNRYLADLRGPLANTLAARISGLVNRVGFDMIYFDAGELNKVQGPYWYWVGVQQMKIWQGVRRDLLMQGSGATNWTWHLFARGTCEDMAAVAVKEYLDKEKIAVALKDYQDAFVPAELGWTGLLSDAPDHSATTPDEMEYYLVRMLALNLPESIQTTEAQLKANGRTDEMLSMMGQYEKMRLSAAVPSDMRMKLATGEWHMTRDGEFHPIHYDEVLIAAPGQYRFTNQFGTQPLKFRLQVAPMLSQATASGSIVLLPKENAREIPPPSPTAGMPGALASHVAFSDLVAGRELTTSQFGGTKGSQSLDLTKHRSLTITLDVEGPERALSPVLNVQLEDIGADFRNYYIRLDFRGIKTVELSQPETTRMLTEFRPMAANYAFKRALYTFSYGHVTGVNFRWAQYNRNSDVRCTVRSLEALEEQSSSVIGTAVSVAGSSILIPGTMNTGDYAEYWGNGELSIFDHNGVLQRKVPVSTSPLVRAGQDIVQVKTTNASNFRFTLITMGN